MHCARGADVGRVRCLAQEHIDSGRHRDSLDGTILGICQLPPSRRPGAMSSRKVRATVDRSPLFGAKGPSTSPVMGTSERKEEESGKRLQPKISRQLAASVKTCSGSRKVQLHDII
ncbi:unnamed protein product [Pleuronectes platessa]|uniref:Uncharacterized protein n=1 Tax=Pleuronectes platessa TaxID=8262 RepID=A0A9N7YXL4_PLEPL|nr:unnamed protein product [Pleuronectes platessa]